MLFYTDRHNEISSMVFYGKGLTSEDKINNDLRFMSRAGGADASKI
jgi:hypothetical protein